MNPTATKPQKSSLWIWTTLWLTSFIDSALLYSLFIFVIAFSLPNASESFQTFLILICLLISLLLGSYVAVKYVLKKSIVLKGSANKMALLAVVVPIIFWCLRFLGGVEVIDLVVSIISIAVIYFTIKKMITTYGD
jgi:hypothetical protein